MSDKMLWTWFSRFIRLRDSDDQGNCRCITCGRIGHWKSFDCGHGIGRQHKSTKFHEHNNHAQCKRCNGFEEGRKDVYHVQVDRLYGVGTWDRLLALSRTSCKRGSFEINAMTEHYRKMAQALAKQKGQKF
jgi:hypothetical protein